MKKILFGLTILLYTLLFATNVNASSFNADIIGNDTFENEITLYVQVNNLVDFNGSCNGLCGLVANLSYDTEKLELISIDTLEDFDLIQGEKLVLYKPTGVGSKTKILSMKFKNKSLTKDETTTITLSNITASDGEKDIKTNNTTKTIKLIVKEKVKNNNGNNTTYIPTTKKASLPKSSKNGETKKSSNNYLSSITLSKGRIKFDKDTLIYNVIVDYETTAIEIKAFAEDNKATITGDGSYDLNVGKNVIEITIKAEDKSERTYTLNISRKEKDVVIDEEEKENSYLTQIIITAIILIVGLMGFVIWKQKWNN